MIAAIQKVLSNKIAVFWGVFFSGNILLSFLMSAIRFSIEKQTLVFVIVASATSLLYFLVSCFLVIRCFGYNSKKATIGAYSFMFAVIALSPVTLFFFSMYTPFDYMGFYFSKGLFLGDWSFNFFLYISHWIQNYSA